MAEFSLKDVIDELKALVRASFELPDPEPETYNVLTSIQAASFSFVEAVKAGEIVLPCVVIEVGDLERDEDWGPTNQFLKRAPVSFYYLRNRGSSGNQKDLADPMARFIVAIDDGDAEFNTFQVIETGTLQSDVDCPINTALFGESNVSLLASRGYWTPGFLVDIGNS